MLVLRYSFCELVLNLRDGTLALAQYRLTMLLTLLLGSVVLGLHHTPGPYQEVLHSWEEYLAWCGWWVGLGILSSVGLGTGLHTFLLYLGPHIAAVTMAAYECGSLELPSPPYHCLRPPALHRIMKHIAAQGFVLNLVTPAARNRQRCAPERQSC